MTTGEMTSGVENLEGQAEKILSEARLRAGEILRRANEEANRILAAKLPLDEVKAEREQIIRKAKVEAERQVEEARQKAANIRAATGAASNRRAEEMARRIAGLVSGE